MDRTSNKIVLVGLYLFFLLMIFQNLIKAYFQSEYLFLGYLLGVLLLIYIFIYDMAKKIDIVIYDLDWLIIFYIVIQLIWILPSFLEFPRGAVIGFMYNVRNFLLPYAIIRFTFIGFDNNQRLIKWMVFLIVIVAFYGVYQYYFEWERLINISTSVSVSGYFYSEGKRAYSFLLTPLDLAYSSMIFSLLMFSYILERNKVYSWLTRILFFIVFTFSLILTFTRSALLGFFAGIAGIIFLYLLRIGISWKVIVSIVVVLVILIGIMWWQFPEVISKITRIEDTSATFHFKNFKEGFRIFIKNPFGIGLGRSGWTVVKWQAGEGVFFESSFLQVMVETGIIGIVLLVFIWVKILMISLSNYLLSGNPLFLAIFGITLGVVTGSFFLPVYYFSTAMSFYWGLVAISLSYRGVRVRKEISYPGVFE